jgi:hypothetical protein
MLEDRLKDSDQRGHVIEGLHMELIHFHNWLGQHFQDVEDVPLSIKHFLKGLDGRPRWFNRFSIYCLLQVLATTEDSTRYRIAIDALKSLQTHRIEEGRGCNDLIEFLLVGDWPSFGKGTWFSFMAQAYKETGNLQWLIDTHISALFEGSRRSHIATVQLKASLLYL